MPKKVAFLGLGVMGYPVAGWLNQAGHEVTVYNRSSDKARRWCDQHGGARADAAADAVAGKEFVFSCLGDDPDLREVILDQGVIDAMQPGSTLIDHTTASADMARELASAGAERGVQCLDAPVSGGQAGAEQGKLTVMAGGDAEAFRRAEPLIRCFAGTVRLMGGAGCGQLTKMVNQIAIAGLVQGLSEALNFARRAELDPSKAVEVISQGAAQSWQMDNRWETMMAGEFEFGFAVEWMRKDLRICLQEARRNGAELPVAALVDQFYADVEGMGGGRWDTSSLIARLNRNSPTSPAHPDRTTMTGSQ